MFFKKKIIVTEEMKQTLQSFDEISWLLVVAFRIKKNRIIRIFKKRRKPVWKKF